MPKPATKLLILNLPNPPFQSVTRDYAGGFGTAYYARFEHRMKPCLNPLLPYSAIVAEEAGYDYDILDAQALKLSASQVISEVKKIDPDIIVSMIGLPSINEDARLLKAIKEEFPNSLVAGCGTVCKVMPEEVLLRSRIDLVFRGDFPYISNLVSLLSNFEKFSCDTILKNLPAISYKKGCEVVNNPFEPCGKSFIDYFPSYNRLPLDEYSRFLDLEGNSHLFISILGSKGCPYNCYYCPYPVGFGRKVISRTPQSVVDEIEDLDSCRSISGFLFRDQTFTWNRRYAEKICKEILRRKLNVSWFCESRVDTVSRQLLEMMKKSGCKRIHYGVETGDPCMIKSAKPGVNVHATRKAFYITKQIGIWAHAHLLLGLPGENRATISNTNKFILGLDPDSLDVNFAVPYPGTTLYKTAESNNWLVTRNWTDYSTQKVVMKTNDLNPKELYEARKKLSRDFLKQKVLKLSLHPFHVTNIKLLSRYYIHRIGEEYLPL